MLELITIAFVVGGVIGSVAGYHYARYEM